MSPPSGIITFLFTDIEGSTGHWERRPDLMRPALARHNEIIRTAVGSNGGHIFKTIGDAFCSAFESAEQALKAAIEAQAELAVVHDSSDLPLHVRMALDTGFAETENEDYIGLLPSRTARLLEAAHGGQILLTAETADLLPNHESLRSLGKHTLRNLREPVEVFQPIGAGLGSDFPPIRSQESVPNNLARQLTKFIGRERELETIKRLIDTAPLVTITGEGGCGKTRLAIQAASESLHRYRDGVWMAELGVLTDPAWIAPAIAAVLAIKPRSGVDFNETLMEELRTRSLLLLLDNCEHLVESCAELASTILKSCPGVRILATSREALGIAGESIWRISPMSRPVAKDRTATEIAQFESVRLFADRALMASNAFTLTDGNAGEVAEICKMLEGIPLAIELAAARLRVMNTGQLLRMLEASGRFQVLTGGGRTAPRRQQAMEAAIDWSYDILSNSERILFERLSVFSGGFTLATAEIVCAGSGIDSDEVADLVSRLVEKSLVVPSEVGDDRYRMLETIRQYAAERFVRSRDVNDVVAQHVAHYLALAEEASDQLEQDQKVWLARLDAEHENIRAALSRSQNPLTRMRIGAAVHRFWLARGYIGEGRKWLEQALLDAPDASADLRAKALNATGILAWSDADMESARKLFTRALDLYRKLGSSNRIARTLSNLAMVASETGDQEGAIDLLEESLRLLRSDDDPARKAMVMMNLGVVHQQLDQLDRAEPLFSEAMETFRARNDQSNIAIALDNLGMVSCERGILDDARTRHQEALRIRQEIRDRTCVPYSMIGLAYVLDRSGDCEEAARILGMAESARDAIGVPLSPSMQDAYASLMNSLRSRCPDAESLWQKGFDTPDEQAIDELLKLV